MKLLKIILSAIILTQIISCDSNTSSFGTPNNKQDSSKTEIQLRIAFLGDAEPKPLAEFPHMDSAVKLINLLHLSQNITFVIGVGDIAHKGTEIQYKAATPILQDLTIPFYPIMGNEEHGSSVERYLNYAQKWNSSITETNYILNFDSIAFVFASPDFSRDFTDSGALWIVEQIETLAPKPVALIVHAAQKGVYTEAPDKGVSNTVFIEQVITQPNLAMVISGDLHMDMHRVTHSKKIDHVHYVHIPGLERTKIPDETNHTAMIRIMNIYTNGDVVIDTYTVNDTIPQTEHRYTFSLYSKTITTN